MGSRVSITRPPSNPRGIDIRVKLSELGRRPLPLEAWRGVLPGGLARPIVTTAEAVNARIAGGWIATRFEEWCRKQVWHLSMVE